MCDPINPFTATNTFGVSYNGGYKPDRTLEWIPADTNVVDEKDDFVPPPVLPPSNMLMMTCEGKRFDPRVGGIPQRVMEYDDFTESQQLVQVLPPPTSSSSLKESPQDMWWRLLIMAIIVLFIVLLVTKLK